MSQNRFLKKSTVIFDLDGVIINSEDLFNVADTEFFRRRGICYERAKVISTVMGKGLPESTAILQNIYALEGNIEELLEERRKILAEAYEVGIDFTANFKEFHTSLMKQNIRMCVATASDTALLAIADRRLGLSKIFKENIFTIADVKNKSKPDPAVFLYAAHQMHAAPHRCVVIEDSPNGVLAAKKAGMFCIALTTTHTRDKLNLADIVVDAFHEIQIGKIFMTQEGT